MNWQFLRSLSKRRAPIGVLSLTAIIGEIVIVIFLLYVDAHANEVRSDLSQKDLLRVELITRPTSDFSKAERFEQMQGGAASSKRRPDRDAFSQHSTNISFADELDFKLGNALFRKFWVSSPSSTQASDGLGPFYNARACQSCHLKDGRGRPPVEGEKAVSLFLRLGQLPSTKKQIDMLKQGSKLVFPDPVYGSQLQNFAVPGLAAEGDMELTYSTRVEMLADGTKVKLRVPKYSIRDLSYGPLDVKTILSPRIAPPMIGLGLVEQIHPSDILRLADPDDENNDGISGTTQIIRDATSGDTHIGRFGWKAENATIRSQSAGAFSGDIGLSTPDRTNPAGDCTVKQIDCLRMPTGVQDHLGATEGPDPVLDLVTFYSQNLAVPIRRNVGDAGVLKGKSHFYNLGCVSCHTPKFVTRRDASAKSKAFQLIWPYSDFLLHDMGEGLADGLPVGRAGGRDWRTPPLWGIGLTKLVSGHTSFLHDGRARNLTEAILWHDGEGKASRIGFAKLNKSDRNALLDFLESL